MAPKKKALMSFQKSSCTLSDSKKEVIPCLFVTHRYVALSDNEKTGYKARELKSVHVDAVGNIRQVRHS